LGGTDICLIYSFFIFILFFMQHLGPSTIDMDAKSALQKDQHHHQNKLSIKARE
jgi:hypothetical protein